MLQVRKSCSYGISAIFSQCCFRIETQVSMTVTNFLAFFLGIISWKGASLFNGGGLFFSQRGGGLHFYVGGCPMGGIGLMGGSEKIIGWGVPPIPYSLWETLHILSYCFVVEVTFKLILGYIYKNTNSNIISKTHLICFVPIV